MSDPNLATGPFMEMASLLGLTAAAGLLAIKLRQPVLIAYMLVGILAGPSFFGLVQAHDQIDLLAYPRHSMRLTELVTPLKPLEAMAQGRAAKLLRPGAREADVATVAAGMRRLRRDGYLAAAWMLAHDDIHRWLADYRGRLSVWCGEQDAITQPELVQGVALRYGAPYIAIPQAGHASYLDNEIFFNQQLLRIGEEVRDECTN